MPCNCEGKEKGAGGPALAGGSPQLKSRAPKGPAAHSLRDLTSLLIVFARDIENGVPLEVAVGLWLANLERFLSTHG